MGTELKPLFTPFELKGHGIKNRIVMAPMELLIRQTRNGFVNEGHLQHYGERARSGIGLIIIEARIEQALTASSSMAHMATC